MVVAKEQIRQIISEKNINSVADVHALLFAETHRIGNGCYPRLREKSESNMQSSNKKNGQSQKTLKSQYGEFQIDVPRDRNGEFEPKLIPKYQRDVSGIEEKCSLFMPVVRAQGIFMTSCRTFMELNCQRTW